MAGSSGEIYGAGSPMFDYELEAFLSGDIKPVGDLLAHDDDEPDGGEFAVLHPDHEPPGEGSMALELPHYAGERVVMALAEAA